MTYNSWACLLNAYFGVSNNSHFSLFLLSIIALAPFSFGLSKTNVVDGMLVDNVSIIDCTAMAKDLRVYFIFILFPSYSELCVGSIVFLHFSMFS